MGAHKDRLIQAAELLDMSPDDLMTLLESTYRYPFPDSLIGIARQRQARILSATRVDPEDARTLARAFRELDIHLSAGGTPPEEWREGPDAPDTDGADAWGWQGDPREAGDDRPERPAPDGLGVFAHWSASHDGINVQLDVPDGLRVSVHYNDALMIDQRVSEDGATARDYLADTIAARLEYLRGELRGERISQGELIELQDLAAHIDPGDVELLEAAGVPEFPEEDEPDREPTPAQEEAWDAREDEARGHVLG